MVRNIITQATTVSTELGVSCHLVKYFNFTFHKVSLSQPEVSVGQNVPMRPSNSLVRMVCALRRLIASMLSRRVKQKVKSLLQRYYCWRNQQETADGFLQSITAGNDQTTSLLLLPDSTWKLDMWPAVDAFRQQGGKVCAVLYDLIPMLYPDVVMDEHREQFTRWWIELLDRVDAVMCISQTVRTDFLAWQAQQGRKQLPPEKVGYFYLGSELSFYDPVIHLLSSNIPFFLVVGSLEPRKNHGLVLDAFDQLWLQGLDVRLAIVGAFGWNNELLLARIKHHPELDQRLFLIRDATDRDLFSLYSKCTGLIFASIAEGFGLPIVEAMQRRAYVLCSDIPIFHEVAGEDVSFFDPHNAQSLVLAIRQRIDHLDTTMRPIAEQQPNWIGWHESVQQLLVRALMITDSK